MGCVLTLSFMLTSPSPRRSQHLESSKLHAASDRKLLPRNRLRLESKSHSAPSSIIFLCETLSPIASSSDAHKILFPIPFYTLLGASLTSGSGSTHILNKSQALLLRCAYAPPIFFFLYLFFIDVGLRLLDLFFIFYF